MEIMEAVRAGLKELILPELDKIKEENTQIKVAIELTNKRLDDINLHLIDQSRRIDAVRLELTEKIEGVRSELSEKIEDVRSELTEKIERVQTKFDYRMDQLFQVIVRREEQNKVENRLDYLEREVQKIKMKLAA